MRFLIILCVIAYARAAAAPGPPLDPYGAPVAVERLAPAPPKISAGDINGAAIEAHVEAADHLRAAVDATRQVSDKVSEIHGQAVNNADEQAWRVVDNVKTVEAKLDGAAAGAAPIIAKNIVRGSLAASGAYAASAAPYTAPAPAAPYATPAAPHSAPAVSFTAPEARNAAPAVSLPAPEVSYAAPEVSYAAPEVSYAAPEVSYAAPELSYAASEVSYAAPAVSYSPLASVPYGAPALTYSAPFAPVPYPAPMEYSAPAYTDYSGPVVGGYEFASPLTYAQAW